MNYAKRLKKSPKSFRRLTGIGIKEFEKLNDQLEVSHKCWDNQRREKPDRKRAIGGGMRSRLSVEDRLLMLLIYYRSYVSHVFLGFLFGLDDSNVGRNINPLKPLLAGIFRIPEKRVRFEEGELETLFFDGTEQQIQRPKKGQKKWYSGKKKKHTIKHQVVVIRNQVTAKKKEKQKVRIAAISKATVGKTHDKPIYENARVVKPPGSSSYGDLAYQGTALVIPIKKPKGQKLTPAQKQINREHSRERVVVEHGIGKMKIWKILSDRYRNPRKDHTLIAKNVAGLSNLMFAT